MIRYRLLQLAAVLSALALHVAPSAAQIVAPYDRMLQRLDPATARQLQGVNATLARAPSDIAALNLRGSLEVQAATNSPYSFFWVYLAAKDLERVLQKQPNDFYARHNYGQAAFLAGDVGSDQPNMRLAVAQFTRAIEINPRSARSYMGRGWAWQMLNDEKRSNADYQKALELDPTIRGDLLKEANGINDKRAQLRAAQQTLERMGRYYVDRSVHSQDDCVDKYKGYWTEGECRLSAALNPVP